MLIKDAVALRFAKICQERSISINEFATISGITPSTAYSMMNNSRRDVSIRTIKKFCEGLDMTIIEFFNDEVFNNLEDEIS